MPSFSERWRNVVEGCKLDLTKPSNFVSTADIAKFGGMETRRMVSIDTEKKQPDIFKQFGVFATPLSTRRVAIVHGKGFEKIQEITTPIQTHKTDFALPDFLKNRKGEANFLNHAYNTGLVWEFTKHPALRPSFSAKMRTSFTFRVDGLEPLKVEGAQIEVDASFADHESFYLVEAKFTTPDSFNIRQLFYPFKSFVTEAKPRQVRNLFFTYEPTPIDEYRFWEYTFTDPDDYEKIELVRSARYKVQFSQEPLPIKQYADKAVQMKAIQANNIFFLMDIPFAVIDGKDDPAQIADHLGLVRRQGQYYREALEILGFLDRRGHKSVLTSTGEEYLKLPVQQRTKFFIDKLSEYPPVSEIIHRILAKERIGEKERKEIIRSRYGSKIGGDTIRRRADCLRKYFEFIADVMGYCKVENGVISLADPRDTLDGFR